MMNHRTFLLVAIAALVFAAAACGDDDDAPAVDASLGIDSSSSIDGSPGIDSSPGPDATVFDSGPALDASAAAASFCAGVETTCTFGAADRYADLNDCLTSYEGYCSARQSCVETHLGLAPSNIDFHCPHVAGAPRCGTAQCP